MKNKHSAISGVIYEPVELSDIQKYCCSKIKESNNKSDIEFDCALNAAGWALHSEISKHGEVSGHIFNNLKGASKVAIDCYIDESTKNKRPGPEVYTQEMFDNDRQPLAGMKAMASVNGDRSFECTVKYLGDVIVIEDTCPAERAYQSSELTFTPIDPRTPKEKLIDKLSYEFKASPEFSKVSTNDHNEWDLRTVLGVFIDKGYFGEIKS